MLVKMEKIRILQIVPNMQSGGLENFIMNLYRNIDRSKIQFDFLVHYKERKHFDDEIETLGGKIHRFSVREDHNYIKYIKQLNEFFKKHKEYQTIHCHMSSIGFICFLIAKINGVKVRIAHSHNTATEKTKKGILKRLLMLPYKYVSTCNLACSQGAGQYLYGKKPFTVIPNGIEIEKFTYNKEYRKEIRDELNLKDELVVGHIGRMERQKNHVFLIDIFKEIVEEKNDAKLLLLGSGELKEKLQNKVKEMNLEKNVHFLGVRKDANKIYSAIDYFVLPSLFEGLPLVGVEAQIAGLNCFFSDTITTECKIIEKTQYISLKENSKEWAKIILESANMDKREVSSKEITASGFDIKEVAEKMEKIYLNSEENKC